MAEARLKQRLWVQAVLRTADGRGQPGAVLRRGDPDAGGVLVVLHGRAGMCAYSRVAAADGADAWMRSTGPDPMDQAGIDAYVARQVGRDPDLWVLEFEAPDLLLPFEARLA